MTTPICHPERKHKARGLCSRCYWKKQKTEYRFNVTTEEIDKMLQEQKGLCAICNCPEPVPGKRLAIDHNHKTGKNRALLCSLCNMGLGLFRDNPDFLARAVVYLAEKE